MDSIAASTRTLPSYEQFYGFAQSPFSLSPDPRFLYRSESHEHAITALFQALRRREGFIVLTGDIGTGKTTVCRAVTEQLGATTFTSVLLNPLLSIDELLRDVLLDFGVVSKDAVRSGRLADTTTNQLIGTLQDFLRSLEALGASALIVIDEAHHLSPGVLEQLRIITGLQAGDARLLQILLVGQLDLLDVLGEAKLRQLNQRVSLRATLEPLDREAMEAYINWRLSVARSSTSVAFEGKALDLIHALSGGVPRVVNLLCDGALAAGAADAVTDITPAHVRTAAAGLGLAVPAESGWRNRTRIAALAAAIVVLAGAAVLAAIPADRIMPLSQPRAPAAPVRRLASPATPIAVPEDALVPLPPVPQPLVRRTPLPPPPPFDPLPRVP